MAKPKGMTVTEFMQRFPTDDACLDHLMKVRYGDTVKCPSCGKEGRFHRVRKRPVYECAWCGRHISPMVGTPFENSHTPLQKWFYVLHMFTTTRTGVSAKEIQRAIGCTYKTAWRMGHEIRKYMAWVDGDDTLGGGSGVIEADKAWIGGKAPMEKRDENKTIVLGMVERGGEVITRVVPNRTQKAVTPHFTKILSGDRGFTPTSLARFTICRRAVIGISGSTTKPRNMCAGRFIRIPLRASGRGSSAA